MYRNINLRCLLELSTDHSINKKNSKKSLSISCNNYIYLKLNMNYNILIKLKLPSAARFSMSTCFTQRIKNEGPDGSCLCV